MAPAKDAGLYQTLYQISKILLKEDAFEALSKRLLERAVEATGALRGYIVSRKGDSFEDLHQVGYHAEQSENEVHRFSRSLVRVVFHTGKLLFLPDLLSHPGISPESLQGMESGAVLVAPLRDKDTIYGVIYLDTCGGQGDFKPHARSFLDELAAIAGTYVRRALERENLRERNLALERNLCARHEFQGIITQHPGMLRLLKMVAQVADSDASVLILGETGTGKELIAQAIHHNSPRRDQPFVAVHCAALPSSLLESELFGHARGAYTGARTARAGRITSAHLGTLFLDEVAELTLEVQTKLLRFLENGEIQSIGSDANKTVDARIIAATHQNLREGIKKGSFRRDLYHRLKVVELEIPPLRERRGDLDLLVNHFLSQYQRPGQKVLQLTPEARRILQGYSFPGNVRELAHLIERGCILAMGDALDADLLPPEIKQEGGGQPAFGELTAEGLKRVKESAAQRLEHDFLEELLRVSDGNISQAARVSGIRRTFLHKLINRHGLDVDHYRSANSS